MIQTSKIFRLVTRQAEPEPEAVDEFDAYKGLYEWLQQFNDRQQDRILMVVAERLHDERANRFRE
jgi:hypothetical protein